MNRAEIFGYYRGGGDRISKVRKLRKEAKQAYTEGMRAAATLDSHAFMLTACQQWSETTKKYRGGALASKAKAAIAALAAYSTWQQTSDSVRTMRTAYRNSADPVSPRNEARAHWARRVSKIMASIPGYSGGRATIAGKEDLPRWGYQKQSYSRTSFAHMLVPPGWLYRALSAKKAGLPLTEGQTYLLFDWKLRQSTAEFEFYHVVHLKKNSSGDFSNGTYVRFIPTGTQVFTRSKSLAGQIKAWEKGMAKLSKGRLLSATW